MAWLTELAAVLADTVFDVLPILAVLVFFQLFVLRQKLANPRRIAIGFLYVLVGLTLFLVGLEKALFPLGEAMAAQLTADAMEGVVQGAADPASLWQRYFWVYVFAAAIGFATTVAEPALLAVALKASEVSGQSLNPWGLRIAVAIGVAIGVALGTFRIVTGTPLPYYIIAGYIVVIGQTFVAPRAIIPLAYDSGGVTTSTVTVPLITALGLGLASTIPGRSPIIDGFGLIAFASLFPMITVMAYAQITQFRAQRRSRRPEEDS